MRTAVSIALVLYCLIANATSLSSHVRGYDLESLGWAAALSLFGGMLRTVFTLATDSSVVESIPKELLKDALVAVIAGVVVYIGIEAVTANGWFDVSNELRFAVIVFTGWSRLAFFGWLDRLSTELTEAVSAKIKGKE